MTRRKGCIYNVQAIKILWWRYSDEEILRMTTLAVFHDIGVYKVEEMDRLTKEEYELIKGHTIVGYNILSNMGIDDIRDIAILHHERLNGTGYPFGLKDDQISKEARIVAVADILSALIGKRSYKDEFLKGGGYINIIKYGV